MNISLVTVRIHRALGFGCARKLRCHLARRFFEAGCSRDLSAMIGGLLTRTKESRRLIYSSYGTQSQYYYSAVVKSGAHRLLAGKCPWPGPSHSLNLTPRSMVRNKRGLTVRSCGRHFAACCSRTRRSRMSEGTATYTAKRDSEFVSRFLSHKGP